MLKSWTRKIGGGLGSLAWLAFSAMLLAFGGAFLGACIGWILGTAIAMESTLPWWSDGIPYVNGLLVQCAAAGATLVVALAAWEAYGEVPYTRCRERHHAAA